MLKIKKMLSTIMAIAITGTCMLENVSALDAEKIPESISDKKCEIITYNDPVDKSFNDGPCLKGTRTSDKKIEYVDSVESPMNSKNSLKGAKSSLPSWKYLNTSPCFPPIGDQKYQGSCVTFATTYYQFSYEVNRYNGVVSSSDRVIYSPKWVYNLVNGGYNNGTEIGMNYNVLKNFGCLTNSDLPYTGTNSENDYTYVPALMKQQKLNALKTRVSNVHKISLPSSSQITSPTDSKLNEIKSALVNGKLLTVSSPFMWDSYYDGIESISFRCVRPADDPNGGHTFTIVGYDDRIGYDVNGNGIIETTEKGAFRIANSWGTSYNAYGMKTTTGFSWILYDALNADSAISGNWENRFVGTRFPAFGFNEEIDLMGLNNDFYYIDVEKSDSNYIGELFLNVGDRYQTDLQIDKSSSTTYNWDKNNIHIYPFESGSNNKTLSFNGYMYVDYSDFASPILNYLNGYKWHLRTCLSSCNDILKFRMVDDLIKPITSYVTTDNSSYVHCLYRNISLPIGDLSYSGNLDSNDVTLLSNHISGNRSLSTLQKNIADVNRDGVINIRDVAELRRRIN